MRLAAARTSVKGIMPWILEELEPGYAWPRWYPKEITALSRSFVIATHH